MSRLARQLVEINPETRGPVLPAWSFAEHRRGLERPAAPRINFSGRVALWEWPMAGEDEPAAGGTAGAAEFRRDVHPPCAGSQDESDDPDDDLSPSSSGAFLDDLRYVVRVS
jgi:hypothetical protein